MRQVQANPTLDKPSQRLGLAGSGNLGPVLRGLGGTISIEIERDEVLDEVRIYSQGTNQFENQMLSSGTFTHLSNGRRKWSRDIVYGVDTDYGISGGKAVRNYLEWTVRKRGVENPSGAPASDKFLSSDETAIRNLSDEALRRNRPFFTPRNYSESAAGSVAGDVIEASGMTWREDNATLWVVSDDRKIAIYDRDLKRVRAPIDLPSSLGFVDTEAIVYMGSDRFAVLDEGSVGSRPAKLHLFHLRFGQDEIDETNLVTYELSSITEFPGGLGAEALAYDRVSGLFYVGTQPTTDPSGGGLWEIDIANKNTDGEPTQTFLYRWFDKLVILGHLQAGALLGDLFYSGTIAGGQLRRSLLCHFRTPDGGGAEKMRRVIQVDIDSGLYVDHYVHNLDGKWEAFTASPGLEDLFFAREGGGQNIRRHDHTAFEEKATFRRQFYVRDVPLRGGVYINGEEAQQGEAWVFVNKNDPNPYGRNASISINVLPTFNDEFFRQHEYEGDFGNQIGLRFFVGGSLETKYGKRKANRFAQTLRNIGGVRTVEVFADANLTTPIIEETRIENLGGYYWENPSFGQHRITARLRSEFGSSNYVDIVGYVRFRQFECT